MEGNDPHGGHEYVCEGGTVFVGVSRGMVEVPSHGSPRHARAE